MKSIFRLLLLLLVIISMLASAVSCVEEKPEASVEESAQQSSEESSEQSAEAKEPIDYAASVKLDMSSSTLKQKVTVKSYIDGDTTHFHVPTSVVDTGVLKARYLGINTPESTGKIEEYGKAASRFTKEKLSNATSVYIESDDGAWNADSTGGRYLVWVWYRTDENAEYRNLNIEILQNGLAIAHSAANNRYGDVCMEAIYQAREQKLNMYSGIKDPDIYYGEAIELTLKELRLNIKDYEGKKVAFNGVITKNNNNGVYVEDYDSETDMYFGMYVYYGFGLSGEGLDVLSVGNLSRIVGTVQYWETGASYQISGLTYKVMRPKDPENVQIVDNSKFHEPSFFKVDASRFIEGKVEIEVEDGDETKIVEKSFAELALNSTISMDNLTVIDIYTTNNPESDSNGAMTLTCTCDGKTVSVRTVVFRDQDGNLIKDTAYQGKTINVRGIVDTFDGQYQIKVFSPSDITIVNN